MQKELEDAGVEAFSGAFDIADNDQLEKFLQQTSDKFGAPISILVNNAGIYATQPLQNHPLEEWRNIIETNLTGTMRACRFVLPAMIAMNSGRIVNISSISGKSGEPYGAAYSSSKFAMIGLTQSLALEVARHGITVNAVCPGWVETDMAYEQLTDRRWCELNNLPVEDSVEIARLSIPREKFVKAEEVAALVRFLCSEEAQSITGQAINICGGLSIH